MRDFAELTYDAYTADGIFIMSSVDRTLQLYEADGTTEKDEIYYIGAQNDINIQHIIIKLDRYLEGKDLSTANKVYIFFKTREIQPVRITLNENHQYCDDNYIYLEWIIDNKITQYSGAMDFSICLQKQTESVIEWDLNSQSTTVEVVPSIHTENEVPSVNDDTYEDYDSWTKSEFTYRSDIGEIPVPEEFNDDNCIFIDGDTRALSISNAINLGFETDHMVKTLYIRFPLTAADVQMNGDWEFYAKYNNAQNQGDKSQLTVIHVEDYIYCAWCIPIGVTQRAGQVGISFSALKKTGGKIEQLFNSGEDSLPVFASIQGVNTLEITSLTDELLFSKLQHLLSKSHSIILNGNVW